MTAAAGLENFALILLPGIDGSGVMFEPLLLALPRTVRPIAVAYPPNRTLGYAELLPLVSAAIPDDVPYIILGESFSGPLALMAAQAGDARLRGVILCATFVKDPVSWAPAALKRSLPSWIFKLCGFAARAKARTSGYSTPELQSLLGRAHSQVTAKVLAARAKAIFSVDVDAALRACPVPILYIRGDDDDVVPERSLELIVRLRPSVCVARLAAPHPLLQTHSREAAKVIMEFAGSLAR